MAIEAPRQRRIVSRETATRRIVTRRVVEQEAFKPRATTDKDVSETYKLAEGVQPLQYQRELLEISRGVMRDAFRQYGDRTSDLDTEALVGEVQRRIIDAGGEIPYEVVGDIEPALARAYQLEVPPQAQERTLFRRAREMGIEQREGGPGAPGTIDLTELPPGPPEEPPDIVLGRPVQGIRPTGQPEDPEEAARLAALEDAAFARGDRFAQAELMRRRVDKEGAFTQAVLKFDPEQMAGRYAAGFAQAVIEVPQAVAAELEAGNRAPIEREIYQLGGDPTKVIGKPIFQFNLVRELEARGFLRDATIIDRIAQVGGEVTGFLTPLSMTIQAARLPQLAAKGGFLGLSAYGAESTLFGLTSTLSLRQHARVDGAGVDQLTPRDYIQNGLLAAGVPLLGRGLNAGINAAERLTQTTIGRGVRQAVNNVVLGAGLEGGGTAIQLAPGGITKEEAEEIIVRAVGGTMGFALSGVYDTLFPEPARSRTDRGMEHQIKLVETVIRERGLIGDRVRAPRASYETEQMVRREQARGFLENNEVRLTGKPAKVTEADLVQLYGVTEPEATRLLKEATRLPRSARQQIRERKLNEAKVLLAETMDPLLAQETEYRLGLMDAVRKRSWELHRREFTPEQQKALSEHMPSDEQALRFVKDNPLAEATIEGMIDVRSALRRAELRERMIGPKRLGFEEKPPGQPSEATAAPEPVKGVFEGEPRFYGTPEGEVSKRAPQPPRKPGLLPEPIFESGVRKLQRAFRGGGPQAGRRPGLRIETPKPRPPVTKRELPPARAAEEPTTLPKLTAAQEQRLTRRDTGKLAPQPDRFFPRERLDKVPEPKKVVGFSDRPIGEYADQVGRVETPGGHIIRGKDFSMLVIEPAATPSQRRRTRLMSELRPGARTQGALRRLERGRRPGPRETRAVVNAVEQLGLKKALKTVEFTKGNPLAERILDIIDDQRLPAEYRKALKESTKELKEVRAEVNDQTMDKLQGWEKGMDILSLGMLAGSAVAASMGEDEVAEGIGLAALPFLRLRGRKSTKPTTFQEAWSKTSREATDNISRGGAHRERARAARDNWETMVRGELNQKQQQAMLEALKDIEILPDGIRFKTDKVRVKRVDRTTGEVLQDDILEAPGQKIVRDLLHDPELVYERIDSQRFTDFTSGKLKGVMDDLAEKGMLSLTRALQELGPGGELLAVGFADQIYNRRVSQAVYRTTLRHPDQFGYGKWENDGVNYHDPLSLSPFGKLRGKVYDREHHLNEVIENDLLGKKRVTPQDKQIAVFAEISWRMQTGEAGKHYGSSKAMPGFRKSDPKTEANIQQFIQIQDDYAGVARAVANSLGVQTLQWLNPGGSYFGFQAREELHRPFIGNGQVKFEADPTPTSTSSKSIRARLGALQERAVRFKGVGEGKLKRATMSPYQKALDRAWELQEGVAQDMISRGVKAINRVEAFRTKKEAMAKLEELKKDGTGHPYKVVKQGSKWEIQWKGLIDRATIQAHLDQSAERRFDPMFNRPFDEVVEKRSGFLDQHRLLDTRVGKVHDPVKFFDRYYGDVYNRIEGARVWGANYETAKKIIDRMTAAGLPRQAVVDLFNGANGTHQTYNSRARDTFTLFGNELNALAGGKRLGIAAFSQFNSWAKTVVHTRAVLAGREWFRMAPRILAALPVAPQAFRDKFARNEIDRLIAESGATVESEWHGLLADGRGFFPKIVGAELRLNATLGVDRLGRQHGVMAGSSYFRVLRAEYVDALRSANKGRIREKAALLEELISDPQILATALKPGKLTVGEQRFLESYSGQQIVRRAHGRTEVIDMPLMMQHKWGRHLYKLQQFTFRMTAESFNEVERMWRLWQRGQRKQVLNRLAKYTALVGVGGLQLAARRQFLSLLGGGRRDRDENVLRQWLDWSTYVGVFSWNVDMWDGVIQDRYGKGPIRFLGPVGEELFDVAEMLRQSGARFPQSYYPLMGYTLESVPEPWRSWLELRDMGREMRQIKQDDILVEMQVVPDPNAAPPPRRKRSRKIRSRSRQ